MHRGFTDLPSADPNPFPWAPSGPEEWKGYTIVLDNDEYLTEFFRVQFEFESRLGNNIYLDDINIQGFGNTEVAEALDGLTRSWTLAPNPSPSEASREHDAGVCGGVPDPSRRHGRHDHPRRVRSHPLSRGQSLGCGQPRLVPCRPANAGRVPRAFGHRRRRAAHVALGHSMRTSRR